MKPDLKPEFVRGEHDGISYEIELLKLTKWTLQRVTVMREGTAINRRPRQHSWDTRDEAIAEAMEMVRSLASSRS